MALHTVLSDLEKVIESTPAEKNVECENLQITLDRVLDEIKSGEPLDDSLRTRFVEAFNKMYTYPNWYILQATSFGLAHVFAASGVAVKGLLSSTTLVQTLLSNLANPKREVRDAVAQALGALAASIGVEVFDFVTAPLRKAVAETESFECLEGNMMACGYLGYKCRDITQEHVRALLDLLIPTASHTAFGSYSGYGRLQAVRGLDRMARSKSAQRFFSEEDIRQRVTALIFQRFDDDDINVRRAAAQLHNSLSLYLISSSSDPKATVERTFTELIEALAKATRWENRQGLNLAILHLVNQDSVVNHITTSLLDKLSECLIQQIRVEIAKGASDVASSANAAAGNALTQLFITKFGPRAASSVDDLAAAVAAISIGEGEVSATTFYTTKVHPQIMYMLTSSRPSLLDAGGNCLQKLMTKLPEFMKLHSTELLCLMFKNKFHASLPVRDSAFKNWRAAAAAASADEHTFMASITHALLAALLKEATAHNCEVREAVFKGMEEMMRQQQPPAMLTEKDTALTVTDALIKGSTNTAGNDSEYPRAAAVAALSAYLTLLSSAPIAQDAAFVKERFDKIIPLAKKLLGDEYENVTIAALNLVNGLVKCWWATLLRYRATIATPVLCAANASLETVRFTAVPILVALLGNLNDVEPALLVAIANAFTGRFSLSEDDNEEDEAREAVARALRAVASLPALAKCADKAVPNLLLVAVSGLKPDLDNQTIQANSLAALAALLQHKQAQAILGGSKGRKVTKCVLELCAHMLVANEENYDFDDEVLEEENFELPEDEEEEGSEDEDEEPLDFSDLKVKKGKVQSSEFALSRALLLAHVVALALINVPAEARKQFLDVYFGLLKTVAAEQPEYRRVAVLSVATLNRLAKIQHATDLALPSDSPAAVVVAAEEARALSSAVVESSFSALSLEDKLVTLQKLEAACRAGLEVNGSSLYSAVLAESARNDAQAPSSRLLKGRQVSLISALLPSAARKPYDAFVELCTQFDLNAQQSEEGDSLLVHEATASVPAVQLGEFSPLYVQSLVHSAADALLGSLDAASRDQLISGVANFITNELKNFAPAKRTVTNVDGKEEEEDEEESETVRGTRSARKKALLVLAHCLSLPYFTAEQRRALLDVIAARVFEISEGAAPQPEYNYICRLLASIVQSTPVEQLASLRDRFQAMVALISQKWFRHYDDGRPAVALATACCFIARAFPKDEGQKVKQLLADVMADEDLGESKSSLVDLLQQFPTWFGEVPFILPPPTAINMAKMSETFSKFA